MTEMETGRPHDEADMRFLQLKVENAYRQRIRSCSPSEAAKLFERDAGRRADPRLWALPL